MGSDKETPCPRTFLSVVWNIFPECSSLPPSRKVFASILGVRCKASVTLCLQTMFYFSVVVTSPQFIVYLNSSLSLARLLVWTSTRRNHPFSSGELAIFQSNLFSLLLASEKGVFLSHILGSLNPPKLLASQFSSLLHDLKSSVQGWIGNHLTYVGRLELIRSVLFGKVQFWLNILSIPDVVMRNIISICRNFLWTCDVQRSTSALVAWKNICMPKTKGGLGLFDLRARNRSFLGKQLWNVHFKTDSVWIRWIHHFYLSSGTIWTVQAHHSTSLLWKAIISVRDLILQHCGDSESSITLMSSWSTGAGSFMSHAYDFFRPVGSTISRVRVIWEQWSLSKYSFILWLAVLGKLRTRDRLSFVPIDPNCVFCRQA